MLVCLSASATLVHIKEERSPDKQGSLGCEMAAVYPVYRFIESFLTFLHVSCPFVISICLHKKTRKKKECCSIESVNAPVSIKLQYSIWFSLVRVIRLVAYWFLKIKRQMMADVHPSTSVHSIKLTGLSISWRFIIHLFVRITYYSVGMSI